MRAPERSKTGLKRLIRLGRENEIAFCQTVDLVGPDLELHFSPCQKNIRVVSLLLGQVPHPVGEAESLNEIIELVLFFEMVPVHHPPTASHLAMELGQFFPLQGGTTPLQGTHCFAANPLIGDTSSAGWETDSSGSNRDSDRWAPAASALKELKNTLSANPSAVQPGETARQEGVARRARRQGTRPASGKTPILISRFHKYFGYVETRRLALRK